LISFVINGKCCSAIGHSRVEALEKKKMNIREKMFHRRTMERVERVDAKSHERNHEVEDNSRKFLKNKSTFFSSHRKCSILYLVL
jgi:hypothetical protein